MPIKLTTKDFIEKAQAKHGVARYDYSAVAYVGSKEYVEIRCITHGSFFQSPNAHLKGNGCPLCASSHKGWYTTARFVDACKERFPSLDFSETVCTGCFSKVRVVCSEHGPFFAVARDLLHKMEHGCPICANKSTAARGRQRWIEQANGRKGKMYFVRLFSENESFCKVGITYREVSRRLSCARVSGYQYEMLALYESENAAAVYDWEQSILETFAHLRYQPKQYFDGVSECFSSADEILSIFPL